MTVIEAQDAVKRLQHTEDDAAATVLFLKRIVTVQYASAACYRASRMLGVLPA